MLTRFNQAHVARESGDHARAVTIYNDVITSASQMEMLDVELGARAGRGLSALARNELEAAQTDASAIDQKLADRRNWAFQGRELVEALMVRISIVTKEMEKAIVRLTDALPIQRDASAVTWLLADCAPTLLKAGGFLPVSILARMTSPVAHGKRISTPGTQPRALA
jgi:hypothetical protein